MHKNDSIIGRAFNDFFNFIYDFSGRSGLSIIKKEAKISEEQIFTQEELFDRQLWDQLFEATTRVLNISQQRLLELSYRFFDSSPEEKQGEELNSSGLCPLPFAQLFLSNTGDIVPCNCLREHKLGNINEDSLINIWNDKPMQDFRNTMINKTFDFCKGMMNNYKCHETHNSLKFIPSFNYQPIQNNPMVRLDLDLNGKCNLACIMCEIHKGPNGTYTDENFWEEAEKDYFPFLKEVSLMGGEPMIQPDIHRLMDLFKTLNPTCLWTITTNGQFSLNSKMKDRFDGINLEQIGISLDSLNPEVYAQIRVGGQLDKPLEMIQDLIKYNQSRGRTRKFLIVANFLITKQTWMELPDYYEYAFKNKIKVNLEVMLEPHNQSIYNFSDAKRREILEFYIKVNNDLLNTRVMSVITTIFKTLGPVEKITIINMYQELQEKISTRINRN